MSYLRRLVRGVANLRLKQLLELDKLEHPGTTTNRIDRLAGHDIGQHLATAHIHCPQVDRDLIHPILPGNVDTQITRALPAAAQTPLSDGAPLTRKEDKKRLRDLNAELARDLVRTTGMTHAQVNRELNRLSGITRVTEATVTQLKTRLDKGTRWLNRSA